jgi:hypothetical protein
LKRLVFLILITAVVFSCKKKYPEGGSYSLSSKKARLENSWVIAMAIENDSINKTTDYKETYEGFNMVINKDGTYASLYKLNGTTDVPQAGRWVFSGDKTKVVFTINQGGSYEWTILRLKRKELWVIQNNFNGKKVEFHFIERQAKK